MIDSNEQQCLLVVHYHLVLIDSQHKIMLIFENEIIRDGKMEREERTKIRANEREEMKKRKGRNKVKNTKKILRKGKESL